MKNLGFIYRTAYLVLLTIFTQSYSQDLSLPASPILQYVTVDTASNNVTIAWEKSPTPNLLGYIVYNEVKTVNGYEGDSIDFVPAISNSYTHNNGGKAGQQSLLYTICAVGSNLKYSSPRTPMHGTIHTALVYDSCNNNITLRWNKYIGWEDNVSGYRVYMSEDGGTPVIIAGINANDSSFVEHGIKENTNYDFFVEGVKNDNTVSSSNKISKYTFMPPPPDELILDYASVTSPQSVDLQFRFTIPAQISNFALLRSNQEFSESEQVKTFSNVTSSPFSVQDSVFTSVTKYFYRIAALNTCGTVIETSNLGTNILLQGNNAGTTNSLTWSEYKDFTAGMESYEIYRADADGNMVLAGSPQIQTSFSEDISAFSGQNLSGNILYQIKAIENGGMNFSLSNILEVKIKSDVWFPNAFTPNGDGKNDLFIPRFSLLPEDYMLIIYDRAGAPVFVSEQPENGWDGRINGKNPAPEGVYTYHAQFSSLNGQKDSKTGHVTVFYPQ